MGKLQAELTVQTMKDLRTRLKRRIDCHLLAFLIYSRRYHFTFTVALVTMSSNTVILQLTHSFNYIGCIKKYGNENG